ncbi:hypothetical protein D7X33_21060 [Butyricicoccus sp. 1XD8-22]|nr:hypothetical protein D7X33_21060 [Butyricicoccus sp. 1XD8-22]
MSYLNPYLLLLLSRQLRKKI